MPSKPKAVPEFPPSPPVPPPTVPFAPAELVPPVAAPPPLFVGVFKPAALPRPPVPPFPVKLVMGEGDVMVEVPPFPPVPPPDPPAAPAVPTVKVKIFPAETPIWEEAAPPPPPPFPPEPLLFEPPPPPPPPHAAALTWVTFAGTVNVLLVPGLLSFTCP